MKRAFIIILVFTLITIIVMPVAASDPGECVQQTDRSKTTYLGDNRYVYEGSLGTVYYQDETGLWHDIDNTYDEADKDGFTAKFTKLPYIIRVTDDSKRRIYPDRNNLSYWIEFDKPFPSMGAPKRQGNWFYWDFANAMLGVRICNETIKVGFKLKNDTAPTSITFPFTSQGITRQGRFLYHDGKVVGELRKPIATDADGIDRNCQVTFDSGKVTISLDTTGLAFPIDIDPTLDLSVAASADDDLVEWSNSYWDEEAYDVKAGYDYYGGTPLGSSMRFTGVNISSGATINVAYLTLIASDSVSGTVVRSDLCCENTNNPGQTASYSDHAGRTRTADVVWDNIPAWTEGTSYQSPSIVTPIQTVVDDQDGTGDALIVFWEDKDNRSDQTAYTMREGASWDNPTYDPPAIHIEYTPVTSPTINTDAASNIASTSARLNSTLVDDGGEACEVRWGYGETSQATITAYDSYTTWSGSYTTGQHPYLDVDSLDITTQYFFRVEAQNSEGTDLGDELDFTTESSVSNPSDLRAYPSATSVSLTWAKGAGATNSILRYKIGSYPADETDGTLVYNGTSASTSHTGLERGKTYYYAVWGESGGVYSTGNSETMATTLAAEAGGAGLDEPTEPSRWMSAPDYENLSNFPIVYDAVNDFADSISLPKATAWMLVAIGIATGAAIGIGKTSNSALAGLIAMTIGLALGWAVKIVPFWIPILTAIIATSLFMVSKRETIG